MVSSRILAGGLAVAWLLGLNLAGARAEMIFWRYVPSITSSAGINAPVVYWGNGNAAYGTTIPGATGGNLILQPRLGAPKTALVPNQATPPLTIPIGSVAPSLPWNLNPHQWQNLPLSVQFQVLDPRS